MEIVISGIFWFGGLFSVWVIADPMEPDDRSQAIGVLIACIIALVWLAA